jgi:acetyl-CoA C-acetyltransferase
MGLGPVEASRRRWPSPGMTIDDIDLYEINEAFAVQVLGSADDLGMDWTSSTCTAAPSPSATRSA